MKDADTVDIASGTELSDIAHKAQTTGRRQVLVENGTIVAVVTKVRTRRNSTTIEGDRELRDVLDATRGAWRDLIDAQAFRRQRRELQKDDRTPRSL